MDDQRKRLDIIIFGATGFTGKLAVSEVVKQAKEKQFSWGIAGRNQIKLETVLKEVSEKLGVDMTKVPIVIADVGDEESLLQMVAQARVIVNCVGPYTLYGEAVIKSCLAGGAHQVDISAEPQFSEMMQLEYHNLAADKDLYIVGACGMDCILSDMGVVFLKKQFQGDVNSVEVYMALSPKEPNLCGGTLGHYGTYESGVHGLANANKLQLVRRKLFPNGQPEMKPKLESRSIIHKRDEVGWCFPWIGADRFTILRSQKHFFEVDKERPIQAQVYMGSKWLIKTMVILIMGLICALLAKFHLGRSFLLKFPRLLTAGLFSHEGPSEQNRQKLHLKVTFFGEGWKERATEPEDQHVIPPNKNIVVEVTCKDPGYGSTSVMLLLSAITILKESDKMPGRGGVYPPGAAFAKTSLIDELNKHGIKFAVTSSSEE